jgi:uncharacterized protein (DUF2141 family)
MCCRSLLFVSILASFFLASFFIAEPVSAARIIVTVDGLHSARGKVVIGLYSNPREFLNGDHCDAFYKVRASLAPITVMFDNLSPGPYAVGAHHDENGNDRLDTNVLGLPIEGYALSNGVRAVFSKPEFYQAAFTVGTGDTPVALHIRY